ncbi:lactoylglutathione lyase [Vibrio nigripulchritudo ATCC 27043]|uniref:VOC family protein n=1 Tax=Vibrio nigripulchritudo TaxID=28173 RepID=UPI00021C4295|nr:VOC family protein [Vibrio nigripulchritudo]EGU51934.1 lactoylglutathione lyase [Vibrio nigripulchritudo ATCC 27043]
MTANLNTVDIKAFIPTTNYELCKAFYQDLGFELKNDMGNLAFFSLGQHNFLLQDLPEAQHISEFMMHLQVEDAKAWHQVLTEKQIKEKYQVQVTPVVEQPWGMLDFVVTDPCGVLWRIAQNV